MKYRADIDGLRAVAVTSVLFYHAEVRAFGGGFVGVDVFFVISGFLITSIIAREIGEGRFSVLSFYERRARRILPALFVMIFATLIAGSAILLSADFADLLDSAVSAVLFYSNVHFWATASYFASDSSFKPLLHTWSLAVEEQYYLVFPLFMMLWMRSGRNPLGALALVSALSLALSIWGVTRYPEMTFFLLPPRIWELLAGSLLALGVLRPLHGVGRELAGATGLALILASVLLFDEGTSFPGLNAVWPCLGAALLIHSEGSTANRLLALRPFVFVGLISYSLYLWHWPVIVFARYEGLFFGTLPETVAIIAVCFVLAVVSWRLVEVPVKRRRLLADPRRLLWAAGVSIAGAAAVTVGLAAAYTPNAAETQGVEIGRGEARAAYGEGRCFFSVDALLSTIDPEKCLTRDPARRTYLLIGDSFAAHLWPGLKQALPGTDVLEFTFGGCPPLLTVAARGAPGCRKVVEAVAAAVEKTRFDAILLAANWKSGDLDALADTLTFLEPLTDEVILFGPIVRYRRNLPDIILGSSDPEREVVKYRILPDADDRRMRRLSEKLDVNYISLVDLMCRKDDCLLYDRDGKPIQWDNGHLTPVGSVQLMDIAASRGELPRM